MGSAIKFMKTAHKEIRQSELKLYVLSAAAPMSDSIRLLNEQGADAKFLVVTGAHGEVRGTITDGDIRRGILNGFGLDDPLHLIMSPKPLSCKFDDPHRVDTPNDVPSCFYQPISSVDRC